MEMEKYAAIHSLFIQFFLYSCYYHLHNREKLDHLQYDSLWLFILSVF